MRRRVVLQTGSIALLIVVAFLVPLSITVDRLAEERATSDAERAVQIVAQNLSVSGVSDRAAVVSLLDVMNVGDARLAVAFADGSRVGGPELSGESIERAFGGESFSAPADGGVEVLSPIVRSDGIVATVGALVPNDVLSRNVVAANLLLTALGALLVGIAMVLADRFGQSIVRPVAELSDAARRVADGDLSARVEPGGPPELVEVGSAFNRLVERIGDLLSDERSSVADLAHRLRTPLTALRLSTESDGDPHRLLSDLDDLERTVNHVINEARRPVREGVGAATELGGLVRARAEFWGVLADEQDRRWSVHVAPGSHIVAGHRDDLAAVIDALIGNVLAHTPPGTSFEIEVTFDEQGNSRLVVADQGPGFEFAPEAGVSSTDSTGIGIDIVRRTAEAHGGRLDIDRSGGGARVVVTLP